MNVLGDERDGAPSRTKDQWRRRILLARGAVDASQHEAEAAALATGAQGLAAAGSTVCAYVPVGSEPASPALLDALVAVGARVLLPVAREPGPLRWARYRGVADLVRAPFGLREPSGPALDAGEISAASVVLVPALAVDRRGVRLGRGAGFYDRSLALAAEDARLVAVVRDDEVVAELPEEAHDRRIGWVLTPCAGLRVLGGEYLPA